MSEEKRTLVQSRGYDIQIKVDKKDYTNDITNIRIASSISAPYPIFVISMMLDSRDILLNNLSGKSTMKMIIRHFGRKNVSQVADEELTFELTVMSPKNEMKTKPMVGASSAIELVPVTFVAFPKAALETVSCSVNAVYSNKTPKEILDDLLKKFTKAKLVYDKEGENATKIDQVIITPRSLYSTIKFLDKYYGLFHGASNIGYCTYKNELEIFNLSSRISKNQLFTLHVLSTDDSKNTEIMNKCIDGKNYYTLQPVKDEYTGNTRMRMIGNAYNYVVKPADQFVKIVEKKTPDVIKKYGAMFKKTVIDGDWSGVSNRTTFQTTASSDDGSNEALMHSQIARAMIQNAKLTITLEKDLMLENLLKVGESVKVMTKTAEMINVTGNYLFKASDIVFSKVSLDWVCCATIVLCRSNKEM